MDRDVIVYNIFTKPIDRWIKPAIYFDELDVQDISSEVDSYILPNITADSLENALTQLLQRITKGIQRQETHPAIWISGCFGAGKSMFAKLLATSIDESYVHSDGKRISEHFFAKGSPDLQNNWRNFQKILGSCRSVIFDIGTKSGGIRTQNDEISDPFHITVLKETQKNLGFGKNLHMLEHFFKESSSDPQKLERTDYMHHFQDFLMEEGYQPERFFSEKSSYTQGILFSKFMHKQKPHTFHDDVEWFHNNSEKGCNYSVNKVVAYMRAMRQEYMVQHGKTDLHLFIFVDELYQHVYHNSAEVTNVEALVEAIGIKQPGKIWLIATAQEKLSNITRVGDNEIGKLQDRFPKNYRVHLELSNIKEVLYQIVLRKKESFSNILYNDFEDNTTWTSVKRKRWFSNTLTSIDKEEVIKSYPLAPGALDAIFHLLSQIKILSQRSPSNSTNIRGTLQLLNTMFRDQTSQGNIRNAYLGSWISMNHIYNQQRDSLPKRIVDDVDLHIKEHIQRDTSLKNDLESKQLLIAIVKTVALIGIMGPNYPATIDNIVACLNQNYYQTDNSFYEKVETLLSFDSNIFMCIQDDKNHTYSLRSKNLVIVTKEFIKNRIPTTVIDQCLTREFNRAISSSQHISTDNPQTDYTPPINQPFFFSYHSKHHKFSMRHSVVFIKGSNIPLLPQFHINNSNPIEIRNISVHFWITSNNLEQQARSNSIGNKIIWVIQDPNKSLLKWVQGIAIAQSNYEIMEKKLKMLNADKTHLNRTQKNTEYNGEKKNQRTNLITNQIGFYQELRNMIGEMEPRLFINGQVRTITGVGKFETVRSMVQGILRRDVVIKGLYPKNEYFPSEDDRLEANYHALYEDNQTFQIQNLHEIYTSLGLVENNRITCSKGIPFIFIQALHNISPDRNQNIEDFPLHLQKTDPKLIFMVDDIIRYFLHRPYGFSIHTIVSTIIGLFRSGKINLIYKSHAETKLFSFDAVLQSEHMIDLWKNLCKEPFPVNAWKELKNYFIFVYEREEILSDAEMIQIKKILGSIAIKVKNIDKCENNVHVFIQKLKDIKNNYFKLNSQLKKNLKRLSPYLHKIPELDQNDLHSTYQLIHNLDINEGADCLRELLRIQSKILLLKSKFLEFSKAVKYFLTKHKEYKRRVDFQELNEIFRFCNENVQHLKSYIPKELLSDVHSILQYESEFWNVPSDISSLRKTKNAIENYKKQEIEHRIQYIKENFEQSTNDILGSLEFHRLSVENQENILRIIETHKNIHYDEQKLKNKSITESIQICATIPEYKERINKKIDGYLEVQDQRMLSEEDTVTIGLFGDQKFFENKDSLITYIEKQESLARMHIQQDRPVFFT